MPWTNVNYPEEWANFTPEARQKATEIANNLLELDYPEERAVSVATAQTKEWAQAYGVPVYQAGSSVDETLSNS